MFKDARTESFDVSKDLTYTELVDKVYEMINVDRFSYDLKLEVPYTMGVLPIAPQVLTNDANVSYYLKHKHRKRFPICVSLIAKHIITPPNVIAPTSVCREVYKGKGKEIMVEELSRNEPKKRRNHNDDEHTTLAIEVYDRVEDEDEVYRRDRDDYHNDDYHRDDRDGEECFHGEDNDGVDEHNNEGERGEEFEEFVNRDEYDEFVNNFTVPSGHCQPCEPTNIRLSPECVVPPTKCGPSTWKAPEFTREDVVNDFPTQNRSQSSTGNVDFV